MDHFSTCGKGVDAPTPLDAALSLARLGWAVVLLHSVAASRCTCGDAACERSAGKHPIFPHWQRAATSSVATVRHWFTARPWANGGVATGRASDLLVLDLDVGPRGDGRATLATWEARHGRLATVRVVTPGGGEHVYLRHVEGARNSVGLAAGVDLRTDGGLVVGAGALHRSGGRYGYAPGASPADVAVAAAPAWLVDLVRSPRPNGAPPLPPPPDVPSPADRLERARAYTRSYPGAVSGENGHGVTFTLAQKLVRGFLLSPREAFDVLTAEHNSRCRPPWSPKELAHKVREAAAHGTMAPGALVDTERDAELRADFVALAAEAKSLGYRLEWAAHRFRERHGHYPPRAWNALAGDPNAA